ncbi:DoxX family protein [Methylomarinum sp. Ch1-1]|uniref:DoxX family protein n=1 Tax=Methylomarinum roseum TaxID=3067653 RepID=A0AAU7NQX2_9GAMM|nr:DoxX family protein [Methylomarinum sp. Ch1-1]MDP4520699.1 DoxX family protein [Methylomarinum sp. Ch1-1]
MSDKYTKTLSTRQNTVSLAEFCGAIKKNPLIAFYSRVTAWLERHADQLPPLLLRLILAYEFWEAGMMKLNGENWFAQLNFPFPFGLLSTDALWFMGTWLELIGAIALLLGLGTRIITLSLMVLTIVAIETVHWPAEWSSLSELWRGYAISSKGFGNYKLPLLYLIMFLPLLFRGAGRWSLDHVFRRL